MPYVPYLVGVLNQTPHGSKSKCANHYTTLECASLIRMTWLNDRDGFEGTLKHNKNQG